jgi:hypothetical protein
MRITPEGSKIAPAGQAEHYRGVIRVETAISKRLSHSGANMIQALCWADASMNGEAVFGGSA